jgi:hypothetical protein
MPAATHDYYRSYLKLFLLCCTIMRTGDVPEAAVLESLGVASGPAERDVLEGLPNEEAVQARQVVAALKLSKQELAEHILPEVRGCYTPCYIITCGVACSCFVLYSKPVPVCLWNWRMLVQ